MDNKKLTLDMTYDEWILEGVNTQMGGDLTIEILQEAFDVVGKDIAAILLEIKGL